MARTKISEFSATAGSNTDIDSINLAEGCAPSGINDAIRELMSQLKDFQTGAVGDSFNGPVGSTTAGTGAFTTLAASSTTTLSGLTASTALALDASKNVVSVTNTGTGSNVLATSPTFVTPVLGTPSSGTVTNLTGTASININGTVGATTPAAGSFTTVSASTQINVNGVNNTDGNVLLRSTTTRANTNNYGIRFADSSYETNASIRAIQNNSGNNAAQLVFGVNAGVGGINLTSVTDVATLSSTGLAVTGALSASGQSSFGGALQITGAGVPASGAGMELAGSVSASSITSFNRSLGTYLSQNFNALDYSFATSSTERMRLTSTGLAVTGALSATGATTLNNDLYVEPNTAGKKTFIFTTNAANVGRMDVKSDTTIMVSLSATNGTVTLGNRAVPSDGTGIAFPATQNASSDANTLDDYEEGDWTPSLTFGGGSTGITYDTTNTTATYRKIGSLVMITGYLGLTSKGSSTGDARINTLPFPVKSGKEGYSPVAANRTDSIISIGTINPIAFAGTSGLYFYSTSAAGVATSITDTGFANNSTIYFSFSYATS